MQDEDINKKVDEYFEESRGYRETKEEGWKEDEDFRDGRHWKLSHGKRPVKNFIKAIIESEIPILTDSRPSVDVVPIEQSGFDTAKMLSSAVQWVFEQQSMQLKNTEAIRDCLTTGTAWFYVDYDPDLAHGQGDVTIKILPWRACFPDPNATNVDDCLYFGIELDYRLEDVQRKFPAYAEELIGHEVSHTKDSVGSSIGLNENRWHGAGGYGGDQDSYKLNGMVKVREMWMKDYAMVPIDPQETLDEITKEAEEMLAGKAPDITQYEDHDSHIEAHQELKMLTIAEALGLDPSMITEQDIEAIKQDPIVGTFLSIIDDHIEAHGEYKKVNPEGLKPKYESNLRLVIKSKDLILYDGEAPVHDGLIPVAPVYCYKNSNSIYADGVVKDLKDAQKAYNEMDWIELQGLVLNTNPAWVVDTEAQVDANTITNEPDIVITKSKEGNVTRLPPGQVSPQLSQRKAAEQANMEIIEGVTEATQGRRPTGITAASAIKYLQEQSIGRIRLKTRNYEEYTLLRLGKLVASRVITYYNAERVLRLYNDEGKINFIKFDPKMVENFQYDVRVVPGSAAGLDKESVFQLFSGLLDKGLISPKTFFLTQDIPFRAKILEDIEQQDQMKMMLEQLMMENEQLKAIINPAVADQAGKGTK